MATGRLVSSARSAATRLASRVLYTNARMEPATVWILGTPRSGSTWVLSMLAKAPRVVPIDELGIGSHLGVFTVDVLGTPAPSTEKAYELFYDARRKDENYFFADRYASTWRHRLRSLILSRLRAQVIEARRPVRVRERIAVVKEPNGTQSAGMLLGALPRSRVLALVRDGRDVVDSIVDAMRPESWLTSSLAGGRTLREEERLDFVMLQGRRWVGRTRALLDALAQHDRRRQQLLRYEDLRADTRSAMRGVYSWLGIEVAPEELEAIG